MDRMITVCDACLTAACWHGEFMCDRSRDAGVVKKTEDELLELGLEHPDHFSIDKIEKIEGLRCLSLSKPKSAPHSST